MRNYLTISFFASLLLASTLFARDYLNASRFGNKTANLARIDEDIEELRNSDAKVSVPAFFGIGNDEIISFLAKKGQKEIIEQHWRDYIKAQQEADDLTSEGKAALIGIQNSLRESFLNEEFHLVDEESDKELDAYLNQIGDDNRLMVRSTGKEDTREIANAGGNKSIANVKANRLELSTAILEVLQSYYSERSHKQRIAGGEDKSSLLGPLFMPVLLQLMIGEKSGGAIPVSGVVFSREPFANTDGVIAINSTYGHGETVVNGVYPVDSFFATKPGLVYPVIRNKHTRLIPDAAKVGLQPSANDTRTSKSSSLTKAQVLALKGIALTLERLRDEPVDIEFTLLNDVIYLVQVRPIVIAPNRPSYLTQDFVTSLTGIVGLEPVVSGGGELKHITDESEIIVSQQIGVALDQYLDLNKERRAKIKVIITGQNAPFNSHEATTFRANNKAVFYARDFAAAQKLITSEANIIADGQRGILAAASQFDDIRDRAAGWLKHPIARTLSIRPEFFLDDVAFKFGRQEELKDLSLLDLLSLIRTSDDTDDLGRAMRELTYRINVLSTKALRTRASNHDLKNQNTQLFALMQQFNCHAANILLIGIDNKLERLIALNFLEAILLQQSYQEDVIGAVSILSNIKEHIHEEKLADWLGLESPHSSEAGFAVQFAKLKKYALNEHVDKAWREFLTGYKDINTDINQKFTHLIRDLVALDNIPFWLNMSFWQAWQRNSDTKEALSSMLEEYERAEPYLRKIFSWRKQVRAFVWADLSKPERFATSFENLRAALVEPISDLVTGRYENLSLFERSVSLSLMSDLVNHFDAATKNLSRSNEYDSYQNKARDFHELLVYGNELCEKLAQRLFSDDERKGLHYLIRMHGETDPKSYFRQIREFLRKANLKLEQSEEDAKQLLKPTKSFNVSGARLTSKADFARSTGHGAAPSLEDIFTLIHQNLLTLIGKKLSSEIGPVLPLPNLVDALAKKLIALQIEGKFFDKTELAELVLDQEKLLMTFNQPVNYHSATYTISRRFSDSKLTLRVKFIGDALDRWPLYGSVARWLLPHSMLLKNDEGPYVNMDKGEVDIIWRIESQQQIDNAIEIIKEFAEKSFGYDFRKLASDLLGDYSKGIDKSERINICHKEIFFNLDNNIASKTFAEIMCFHAYDRKKPTAMNAILTLVKDRVASLTAAKKFTLALQYIGLNFLVLPFFQNSNSNKLIGTMLDHGDFSDVNMAQVQFEGRNVFDYFLEQPSEELWERFTEKFSAESFAGKDYEGNTLLHRAVKISTWGEEVDYLIKSLAQRFPEFKSMKNDKGQRPVDIPEIDEDIKKLVEP